MRVHGASWLIALLMFLAPPPVHAQAPYPDCTGFSGWIRTTSWGGAFEMHGGCLTLNNGSVRLNPSPFDFPISDLASLEKKKFELWKGVQFKLRNGKKIQFFPFYDQKTSGADQAAAEVEKAVRDMASQQGVVLK